MERNNFGLELFMFTHLRLISLNLLGLDGWSPFFLLPPAPVSYVNGRRHTRLHPQPPRNEPICCLLTHVHENMIDTTYVVVDLTSIDIELFSSRSIVSCLKLTTQRLHFLRSQLLWIFVSLFSRREFTRPKQFNRKKAGLLATHSAIFMHHEVKGIHFRTFFFLVNFRPDPWWWLLKRLRKEATCK